MLSEIVLDFQVCLDRVYKCGLSFVFLFQSRHDLFVDGILGDEVMDYHGIRFLALPP